ncbi:uncharacterized protein LOC122062020 [Macadamia integrifolia]|uniref:uncharacterized protein LOC122062020 n=1 Tax=Macadamia integrifolia TaxID=60698 RepID=UPI001C528375|nr:uncharacterized protein LOC122062020 [Macadamia integrifolia]
MSSVSKFVKKSSHGSEGFDLNGERKKKLSSRNPLKDLNNINRSRKRSSSSNSSLSIEAPRGWSNSVLSNSSSKTPLRGPKNLPQTPKSAPNPGPSQCRSKPPTKQLPNGGAISGNLEKPKRTSSLYQWENGKKHSFRANRLPKPSSDVEGCGFCANELVSGVFLKEEPLKGKEPVDTAESSSPRLLSDEVDLKEVGTPVKKLAPGFVLGSTSDKAIEEKTTTTNTTPPVQASISPEIQCESSVVSSPTCFGAGHLLSGVTDKRKCRPRGVLTVGDNAVFCKAGAFDGIDRSNDVRHLNASRVSLVPVPTEASVQWLLLPCDEEREDHWGSSRKGSPESGKLPGFSAIHSPSSSSARHGFSSNVCSISSSASTATNTTIYGGGKRRPSLVSPIEFPKYGKFVGPMSTVSQKRHSSDHAIGCSSSCTPVPSTTANLKDDFPPEEREYRYDIRRENSPFSWDSLGSGNVMCTPQSDSSSDIQFGSSCLDGDNHQQHQLELNSMVDILRDTHLSPRSQISMWGVADVPPLPALSAHFSHPVTPLNSVDCAQIQKPLNDLGVDFSCSSFENVSQSQMRISWRDGLVSHVFEMEKSDYCCRLPYEEEEAEALTCCGNGQLKSDLHHGVSQTAKDDLTLNDYFKPLEFAYEEPAIDGEDKVKIPPQRSNVCAESISIEGGGLVTSNDSDWSLCFKNQLFQVHQ